MDEKVKEDNIKIEFYFDVWPWTQNLDDIFPTTKPCKKSIDAIRYKVEVEIPNPRKPDVIISAEAKKE